MLPDAIPSPAPDDPTAPLPPTLVAEWGVNGVLPDPARLPMLTAEEVAPLVRLGRTKTYEMGQRYIDTNGAEGLPCIAFGRTRRFPTAAILQLLGVGVPPASPEPLRDEAPAATAGASRTLSLAATPSRLTGGGRG